MNDSVWRSGAKWRLNGLFVNLAWPQPHDRFGVVYTQQNWGPLAVEQYVDLVIHIFFKSTLIFFFPVLKVSLCVSYNQKLAS